MLKPGVVDGGTHIRLQATFSCTLLVLCLAILGGVSACTGVKPDVTYHNAISIRIPLNKQLLHFDLFADGELISRSPEHIDRGMLDAAKSKAIWSIGERVLTEVAGGDYYSNEASGHPECLIIVQERGVKRIYGLKHDRSLKPAPEILLKLMSEMSGLTPW